MALSKAMLRGYGLNDEQVQAIIDGHMESVTGLQDEVEKHKSENETTTKKLAKVQKELDEMREAAEQNDGKNPYKVKYDALKEEFDAYKADVDAKATKAVKEDAYRALLKEVGISDKRIAAVLKVSDVDGIEIDKDGKIKGVDKLKDSIKEEWSEFITTTGTQGANTPNPPANNGGKMTKDQIMAIKDTVERQKAMMDNKELFIQ